MVTDYKKRVGIIRGGAGEKYNASLKRGGEIILHILENLSDKYKVVDILVDKDGIWHAGGLPINPNDLIHKVDVIWNTSKYSDFSTFFDDLAIPNISNDIFLDSLENDKDKLKKHLKEINIQMPRSILFPVYQEDFDGPKKEYATNKAREVFEKFSAPWVVKSFTPDSNMGIHLAKTFPQLVEAIEDGINHKKSILVEEFILGKVSSAHSISLFRDQDVYVLLPDNFSVGEKEKLISVIKNIHLHLGTKHYLKTDFVLHPKRGLFLTEISFSPDLRKDSHLEKSCEYVGAKTHHISRHILEKTLKRKV